MRFVGIYRDRELRGMRDLDGFPVMPNKFVNVNPSGEESDIQLFPAEADEIIISDLKRNYIAWASSTEGLYVVRLGTKFHGKGLTLAIPWAIVVLNVVITMLSALYERRNEIGILSSSASPLRLDRKSQPYGALACWG